MQTTMEPTYLPAWRIFLQRWGGYIIALGIGAAILAWGYISDPNVTTAVLASAVRQATPLVLGALCGLIGERSGVINIGIEGQMLMAAFIGFLVNVWTGNLLVAVFAGVMTGALLGLLLAWMSVTLKVDQIIGGTVINILAVGLTGYFYTAGLLTKGKLQPIALGPLADIPLIGPVLFDNPPITYITFILVFVVHYVLFYTRWGLRMRSVGEHPKAADTLGINVFRTRYMAVILGGMMAGFGGGYFTLGSVGRFDEVMTAGRGFIGLAAMIFGNWTPFGSFGAGLLFGFTDSLASKLAILGVRIPSEVLLMAPYIATIIVLAGVVGKGQMPAADGKPYEKE